ncbi:Non-heme dioxygenase N-terminal domain-containing protein [Cynara cardunculus var. scolymus]|uniref:Non-heme dioxygenase N-terminal domain-containing protein n=1 Tax=Cynara cardunculus var. scolymus TaxID=59895 RepID=A0A118JSL5_CYNCS|nr:Non-heme dioxygenase N-terminal domain-containing protein [Cynara cardunculus var. scolymus]
MVKLPQFKNDPVVKSCTTKLNKNHFTGIPVIDLSRPHDAKNLIVDACQIYGFFKVVNHGVPPLLVAELENEALGFFNMSPSEKNKYCPPNPLGYGSNKIGPNGDIGGLEYLLLASNNFPTNSKIFSLLAKRYVEEVRKLGCEILELMAEGLKIEPRSVLSRMLSDEKADTVMTNGRFRSVRHRVVADRLKSRVSMIYFGGPPLMEKISPLDSLMEPGEESLYDEFTWFEYKSCTYKTRLADDRLSFFYKPLHT